VRAAVIENGVVTNIIVVESLDCLPGLCLIDAQGADIGDEWDGVQFIRPVPAPATLFSESEVEQLRREIVELKEVIDIMLGGQAI